MNIEFIGCCNERYCMIYVGVGMKDILHDYVGVCMLFLVFWCRMIILIFNHILVVFALFSLTMHLIIRNDRNLVTDHNFDHNYYR